MIDRPAQELVVGVGNRYRRDDGVGLRVARLVREQAPDAVTVVEGISDAYALIDRWNAASSAHVIDCAVSGHAGGHIHRFDALGDSIPTGMFGRYSTHAFDLVDAVRLARALDRLPRRLTLFGIEGTDFTFGTGLTPSVEKAAQRVAGLILTAVGATTGEAVETGSEDA